MTLDEAIAKYKEITNTDAICPAHCNIPCDKCVQESGQVAEWLEELKDYRDKNKMVVRVDVDSIKDKIEELSKYAESQYDKAIDDIKEKLKEQKLGRPFSVISSDPKYNADYLENIIKTKWLKILEEKESEDGE